MQIFKPFLSIIKKYPSIILRVTILLLILNIVEISSVITIAPIVDALTKPSFENASSITLKLI